MATDSTTVGGAQFHGAPAENGSGDSSTSFSDPNSSPLHLYLANAPVTDSEKQRVVEAESILNLPPNTLRYLLDLKKEKIPPLAKAIGWRLTLYHIEGIIDENPRKEVPGEEVAPSGSLRGVLKIICTFDGGRTTSGTAVLIGEKKVVTAAHLLVDGNKYAKHVLIFAGVGGDPGDVEFREGIHAAVPFDWCAKRSWGKDIAFIELVKGFNNTTPFKYRQTPLSDTGTIIAFSDDMPSHAKGEVLCRSTSPVELDLTTGVVQHKADTFFGSSGGGVFDAELILTAIHTACVYKPDGTMINQAVAIDRDGNDFAAFLRVLAYMVKHTPKHFQDNGYAVGDVDIMAGKKGEYRKVEVIGEMKEVGGLVFTW